MLGCVWGRGGGGGGRVGQRCVDGAVRLTVEETNRPPRSRSSMHRQCYARNAETLECETVRTHDTWTWTRFSVAEELAQNGTGSGMARAYILRARVGLPAPFLRVWRESWV